MQGNEKGPDSQAENMRQMLAQHMVIIINNFCFVISNSMLKIC